MELDRGIISPKRYQNKKNLGRRNQMARRKTLPCFRTRKENLELKEKEMLEYKESLGDRKLIYTITKQDKYKDLLSDHQIKWIDNLLAILSKYDVVGSNQIEQIIELSKMAVEIDELNMLMDKDHTLAFEYDEMTSKILNRHCIKLSQFLRYKERLESIFERLFYQYLKINLELFEQLQYEEISEEEINELQTNPKLLLVQLGGVDALLKKGAV